MCSARPDPRRKVKRFAGRTGWCGYLANLVLLKPPVLRPLNYVIFSVYVAHKMLVANKILELSYFGYTDLWKIS